VSAIIVRRVREADDGQLQRRSQSFANYMTGWRSQQWVIRQATEPVICTGPKTLIDY